MKQLKFALAVAAIGVMFGSCSKSEKTELAPNPTAQIADTEQELLASVSDKLGTVGIDVNNLESRSDVFYYAVPGVIDPNCVENNHVSPSCCFQGSICYIVIQEKKGRSDAEDLGLLIPNDGSNDVLVGALNIDQNNPEVHDFSIEGDL